MGLTEKREELLKKMPIIETNVSKSKDGRFLIHRTTITHIKPMAYYEAIVKNSESVDEEDIEDVQQFLAEA